MEIYGVIPLYFENENSDYPITSLGSCFLINYRSQIWGVTAKHIFTSNGYSPSDAMIPYRLGEMDFIPILKPIEFEDSEDMGLWLTDYIVFVVDMDELDRQKIMIDFIYDIDAEIFDGVLDEENVLIYGFPDDLNGLDFEEGLIYQQAIAIFANKPIPSEILQGCMSVTLMSMGEIEEHRGFSGSPIFLVVNEGGNLRLAHLLGVVLAGAGLVKNYIPICFIKALIDHYLDEVST
ncbi:MAG TPA: hypothetical protein VFW58_11900 [Trichococcus sp.]|nr:hypothetical protein [Trichococcus sp.]